MEGSSVSRRLLLKGESENATIKSKPGKWLSTSKDETINFSWNVDRCVLANLVVSFIKHLLCRRGLLSQPFELIEKSVSLPCSDSEKENNPNDFGRIENTLKNLGVKSMSMKERRADALKVQCVQDLSLLFTNLDQVLSSVSCNHSNGISRILILLGSSPVTPKESYLLILSPDHLTSDPRSSSAYLTSDPKSSSAQCHMSSCNLAFLKLLLNSDLLDKDQSGLSSSKLMVFLEAPRQVKPDWFLPYPTFRVPLCKTSCRVFLGSQNPHELLTKGQANLEEEVKAIDLSGVSPLDLITDSEGDGEALLSQSDGAANNASYGILEGPGPGTASSHMIDNGGQIVTKQHQMVTKQHQMVTKQHQLVTKQQDADEEYIWYRAPVYITTKF